MDYNLYVIFSEKNIEKLGICEMKNYWEGKTISYIPRRYIFENKVQMVCSECKMIPKTKKYVEENQISLKVIDGLRELEWDVNKQMKKLKSNDIIKM